MSMLIVLAANLYTPQLVCQLIDHGIEARRWDGMWWAISGLLTVAAIRGLFNFTNAYWSEKASQAIAYDLRNAIYTKLATLSFSYHDTQQTGQLMTRATSDVEAVRSFLAQGILQLVSAVLTFAGSIAILLATDWRLALASLTVIPAIVIIFVVLFKRMNPLYGLVQQHLGLLNHILQENIAGVRVVKSFTAEPRELARYTQQNQVLYEHHLRVIRLFSSGFPSVFALANLGTLIVIGYGGNLVMSNQLSLGSLIAFNSYLSFLLAPIFQLGFLSQNVAQTSASGNRLFEVLDAENDIVERPGASLLPEPCLAHVTFEHVSFRYKGADTDVLHDISFEALPGQTVALLGETGSGKSTIVNLIPRFYDVSQGSVRIDGADVRNLQLEPLRQHIGVVLQDVSLVSGTIRDNIRYGKPDAADEDVREVAAIAQAHDFIMAFPKGYDTVLGERGAGLSGGQRQRIAIARALLVEPQIVIFDDSMSALDVATERNLQRALQPLLDRTTTFIIAQRVSTVHGADLILVIADGRIAAQGTHAELFEASPLYNEILNSHLEADER